MGTFTAGRKFLRHISLDCISPARGAMELPGGADGWLQNSDDDQVYERQIGAWRPAGRPTDDQCMAQLASRQDAEPKNQSHPPMETVTTTI
jgi:hypothetical protein